MKGQTKRQNDKKTDRKERQKDDKRRTRRTERKKIPKDRWTDRQEDRTRMIREKGDKKCLWSILVGALNQTLVFLKRPRTMGLNPGHEYLVVTRK